MRKYIFSILIASLVGTLGWVCLVQAGFGVTPPYVNNDRLMPGSHYEKTIYLVRGQPTQELTAELTIDALGFEEWITVEQGLKFPLPEGVQQFPMKVAVDVPSDAAYGAYEGFIRVRVIPSSREEGTVATLLGARIDISLAVTEKGFSDFRLRGVSIPNVEIGTLLVVLVNLENTGNTRIRPSKVHLDIYDESHLKLLKSGDITEMSWVEPFATKHSRGELPVDLSLGEYWADVTAYKEGESLGINKIYFKVVPKVEKPEAEEEKSFLFLYFPYIGTGIILLIVLLLLIWSEEKMKIVPKEETRSKSRRKKPKKGAAKKRTS